MVLLDAESARARRYLLRGERLVAEVRWHPVWLVRQAAYLLAVVTVGSWLAVQVPVDSPVLDVVGVVLIVAALWFAWQVGEWWNERLVVTDRRLILVTGLLTRKVAVMPLRKVTDMTYERPLIGRLFARYGWGTFIMESAGQDQALHRIAFLPYPEELYRRVSTTIFGDKGMYGSSGTEEEAPTPGRPASRRPTPAVPREDPTVVIRRREED